MLTAQGGDERLIEAFEAGADDFVCKPVKLRELEARLNDDRLVLNEGEFFDKWGRRLKIEEIALQ